MYSLILYQPKTMQLFPAALLRLFAAVCVVVIQAAYRDVLIFRKTGLSCHSRLSAPSQYRRHFFV